MWIVSWNSFLMKKSLKSEICGSVNSARMHYSRLTWSNSAAGKKKKFRKRRHNYNSNPNGHYDCLTMASGRFVVMVVGLIGMDAMSVFFTDLCWHWWWLSREAWIEKEWVLIVWLISIDERERERERERIWWVKIDRDVSKVGSWTYNK